MSTSIMLRAALAADAPAVAELHADSWRRHYRGAYADSFLDGDVDADRRTVWSTWLAAPAGGSVTLLAEDEVGLAGFAHVVLDDDPRWGSLVDNLHVRADRHRGGIGRTLLRRVGAEVTTRAAGAPIYLWVLEQNVRAQRFYAACGGSAGSREILNPPGGVPARLVGVPYKLRYTWPSGAAFR